VRAAGLTGSRAGGRLAVVGPGWSGTGAWTSYALVVPSPQQFEIARVEAREAGRSQDLHRMVSAMQAAAAKCDLAYEEMVRLAVYRLEVERDLGAHLAQTVVRGRPTKRCPGGTISASGLPEGISKKQSVAYQRLAAIRRRVLHGPQAGRDPAQKR
jgi:hypothetical protein